MKLFANATPAVPGRPRRTATILTAALLASLIGAPDPGRSGFVSQAWAQTAEPAAPLGGISKPDTAKAPTPEALIAAKEHYDLGIEFYEHGSYAAARTEFEVSYGLSQSPKVLFHLGKTAEKLNQINDAIRFYDGYLLSGPPAKEAAEVRAKLGALDKRAAAAPPPPPAPPPAPARKLPPTPALALLGIGVGLLIIGIGCGAGALSDANFVTRSGTSTPPVAYSKVADAVSRGRALDGAGIAFDVLGGLTLAAGGAWTGYWFYQQSKVKNKPARAVSLVPVYLGAGLAGSF